MATATCPAALHAGSMNLPQSTYCKLVSLEEWKVKEPEECLSAPLLISGDMEFLDGMEERIQKEKVKGKQILK